MSLGKVNFILLLIIILAAIGCAICLFTGHLPQGAGCFFVAFCVVFIWRYIPPWW